MANEIRVNSGLYIRKTDGANIEYQSRPTSFLATMAGDEGPTPGYVAVTTAGVNVNLSALTTPGMCWLACIDDPDHTGYIEYGAYDPDVGEYMPLGEILPGEFYTIRLSRFLGTSFGTGAGTAAFDTGIVLRLKAVGSACKAVIHAFEK